MTDLEKFIDLYRQFGIDVKPFKDESEGTIKITFFGLEEHATQSEKFHGYNGFYSDVEFTEEGSFYMQGFYE